MSNLTISLLVLISVFGGALIGMFLRRVLPQDHVSAESKSTVNLAIGLIATMAALVLGLWVSAAAASFWAQRDELDQVSTKIVVLDRILDHYGPAALNARKKMREVVEGMLYWIWPGERASDSKAPPRVGNPEVVYDTIQDLSPQDEEQRALKHEALSIAMDIGKTRWLMFVQQTSPLPTLFLVVVALFLGALSLAGGVTCTIIA